MRTTSLQDRFFEQLHNIRDLLDALQSLPDSLFMIKDRDSRYIYMSRELKRAIHFPLEDEIVGKTDFDLFPHIVAERFRQNDLLVLRDGRTLQDELHAAIFFDMPAVWAFSSKSPLRDARGQIVGLITTNRRYTDVVGDDDELNRLLPAIEWITKHFDEKIVIEDLAEMCDVSSSRFMTIFRERLGTTARAFLEQVRLRHAVFALQHSSLPIATIALRCGFYDHSAFVKRFKRLTGSTPLKFRQDSRQKLTSDRRIALPGWVAPQDLGESGSPIDGADS